MAGPGGGYKSGKMRSVSASRFAMVPRNDIPRSAFDASFTHKTTFDAGVLVPVYVDEVLPGDSFRVRMTGFARLATPLVPLMDNIIMESFFFFVPNRLLWENWERFMGEQEGPTDVTTFLVPQIPLLTTDCQPGLLPDYFGITLNNAVNTLSVISLPFRAYNLIWNDWFRDQDLNDLAVVDLDDGPDAIADYQPLFRNKRHDYFTSARPWPQKPTNTDTLSAIAAYPANYVPGGNFTLFNRGLGVGAPVSGLGLGSPAPAPSAPGNVIYTGNRTVLTDFHSTSVTPFRMAATAGTGIPNVRVLVNDIRTAVMVQGLLEKDSRGGTRYAERIRSHFGVTSPDARLQRSEFLGGGRATVTVNPVAQTSASGATGTTTVLGDLAGIGTAIAQGHGFSQSFTEHGVILGLLSVRADMTYQNGTHRMWFRRTQYDFYWPSLAHLGEQAVFSKELWSNGSVDDDGVFGYQERWSEYKYKPSRISGWFRSSTATPLDMWHVAQNFATRPSLNEVFMVEDPPLGRVLQVQEVSASEFLFDSVFDVRMVRAMPMFSLPGVGPRL